MNLSKIFKNKVSTLVALGIIVVVLLVGGVLVWQYSRFTGRVTISVDKREYEQEEKIKIVIKNGLSQSIQYWEGNANRAIPFIIEKFENGEWKKVSMHGGCSCSPQCYEEAPGIMELEPKGEIKYEWDQKEGCQRKLVGIGRYRCWFSYYTSFEPTDYTKNSFTIYSKEFGIKETVQPQEISCQSELAENQARYLGLSCEEFNILEASVREYLYKKYSFTRETEFGIRYERVETAIKGVPQESVVVDTFANFRTPPVVIRAAFYNGNAWVISEESILEK